MRDAAIRHPAPGVVPAYRVVRYPHVFVTMSRGLVALLLLPLLPLRERDDATVTYRTFQVTPDTLRVAMGSTVRWVNEDQIAHTVTGGTPERRVAGWDATLATAGTSASRRFVRTGTFTYFCDRHPFMRGTIVVTNTR